MSGRLQGKVALISGTARGQGAAAKARFELDSVFIASQAAWPQLKASREVILNIDSTAGLTGSLTNQRAAHTASKGGVIAVTRQLARLGTAQDITGAAVFLCSDEAAYITGANLVVDGGWSVVLPGAVEATE